MLRFVDCPNEVPSYCEGLSFAAITRDETGESYARVISAGSLKALQLPESHDMIVDRVLSDDDVDLLLSYSACWHQVKSVKSDTAAMERSMKKFYDKLPQSQQERCSLVLVIARRNSPLAQITVNYHECVQLRNVVKKLLSDECCESHPKYSVESLETGLSTGVLDIDFAANCIPNLCRSLYTPAGQNAYLNRYMSGLKQMVICDIAFSECFADDLTNEIRKFSSMRSVSWGSSRAKVTSNGSKEHLSHSSSPALGVDCSEYYVKQTPSVAFRDFMKLPTSVFYVDTSINQCVTVVWNTFRFHGDSIAIDKRNVASTIFFVRDFERDECKGCPIFDTTLMLANRYQDSSEKKLPRSCPHLELKDVIFASTNVRTTKCPEQIQLFKNRFLQQKQVQLVSCSDHYARCFVYASSVASARSDTEKSYSFISLSAVTSCDVVLECSNVQCKRRKRRHRNLHPKAFCIHFETFWLDSDVRRVIETKLSLKKSWRHLESDDSETSDDERVDRSSESDSDDEDRVPAPTWRQECLRFDPKTGMYEPPQPCPLIPHVVDDSLREWSVRRASGVDLKRMPDDTIFWNESGYLVGLRPCVPTCSLCCDRCLSPYTVLDDGTFVEYTILGPVLRQKVKKLCPG